MTVIKFENATPDDIYKICESLCGWQPYVDSDVCVYDMDGGGMIIGPEQGGETDVELTVSIVRNES